MISYGQEVENGDSNITNKNLMFKAKANNLISDIGDKDIYTITS